MLASSASDTASPWLSVEVKPGEPVYYVAIYNTGASVFQSWLSPFRVCVASAAGGCDYACGGGDGVQSVDAAPGPFYVWCDGEASTGYVTLQLHKPDPSDTGDDPGPDDGHGAPPTPLRTPARAPAPTGPAAAPAAAIAARLFA